MAAVCSEESVEVYDHDPRNPLVGHDSCFPKCKPIDVMVTARRWSTLSGEPITEPDTVALLEARKAGIKWHSSTSPAT